MNSAGPAVFGETGTGSIQRGEHPLTSAFLSLFREHWQGLISDGVGDNDHEIWHL